MKIPETRICVSPAMAYRSAGATVPFNCLLPVPQSLTKPMAATGRREVSIWGGDGAGAKAHGTVSNGVVTAVTVTTTQVPDTKACLRRPTRRLGLRGCFVVLLVLPFDGSEFFLCRSKLERKPCENRVHLL
jgi:hypothetical protein